MSSSIDYSPSPSPSLPPAVVDRALLRATIDARVGRTVDQRYTLTRLLGVGGMAAVYEAVCSNGERVAIKLLHPAHCGRLERRKRFLREAYLANAIGHPGMVRIYADGVDSDGAVFLVMELLEGGTVRELQQRAGGRVDPHLGLRIADQVLDVLAVAHASGVTHRDIKPENLFVTHEGRVKVLDFGVAHMRDEVPGMTLRTQPGVVLGTPSFMAPEQLLNCGDVDRRSDLFALGATLFTLLSGESARGGRSKADPVLQGTIFAARALRSAWPAAPELVAAAVDRALCFEPAARWPDARSMQQALRAAQRSAATLGEFGQLGEANALGPIDELTLVGSTATAVSPARARRRTRAILVVASAALLAVAALLASHARGPEVAPAAPGPTMTKAAQAPATANSPPAPAAAPAAAAAATPELVPRGVSEPETPDSTASQGPADAHRPRAKRVAGRRRYDVVASDIVDPWE